MAASICSSEISRVAQRLQILGAVDEVITSAVLSRLYGSDIEVLRVDGRIFVMAGEFDIERDDHRHHNHAGHGDTSPQDSRSSHV